MAVVLLGVPLFGQTGESPADKVSFELEFNASVLSADSEGVVDSMTDAGFNEDGTKIGLAYEDELWGASVSLAFASENLRFLDGETAADPVLSLDELYGWVKPFGPVVKFTGGIFENTDGVADYTDDIDEYGIGVFVLGGEAGEPFSEPEAVFSSPALVNGFLTDLVVGPVTLQFLLSPNFSKESAAELLGSAMDERYFRIGGRVIADIAGVGTASALFKTFQWPMAMTNALRDEAYILMGIDPSGFPPIPGTKVNWTTFGAYFDLTAVENLGVSLGYTGLTALNDDSDVENTLTSGIDLRATWTGIDGLSLSTHNNVSFAQGKEKDWSGLMADDDASFFTLYNAIGATKELTEKFSVNAVISNILATTDLGVLGKSSTDTFGVSAKFIAKVSDHAEFNIGAALDVTMSSVTGADDETLTVFSVPVGIKVNF
jgi:hypothetical protein